MAQFTIYRSSDASAPTLSGTAGDLTNLLKKVLVNGYGSKAAAGWSNPFSGAANQEVFRPGGGNQFYLQVDDTGPGTGGARQARAFGFETMSAYNTGTNLFPTAAQRSTGLVWDKSTAVSAATNSWLAVADDRTLYLFVYDGQTGTGSVTSLCKVMMFGDFYSFVSNDSYRTVITGSVTEIAGADTSHDGFATAVTTTAVAAAAQAGHYLARPFTGVAGATTWAKFADDPGFNQMSAPGSNGLGVTVINFPNNPDGGLYLAPYYICEPTAQIRGRMRGIYFTPHPFWAGGSTSFAPNFADGQVFSGTGDYAGKTFMFVKGPGQPSTSTWGGIFVETSNTLETN